MNTITHPTTLEILGTRFVLLPETDYQDLLQLRSKDRPLDPSVLDLEDLEDADTFMSMELGRGLRKARETANLTQSQLAKKLRKSQSMVSAAERGTMEIGVRYAKAVLRACGLPEGWKP